MILKQTKLNLKSKIKVKILSHNGEYLTKSAITKQNHMLGIILNQF